MECGTLTALPEGSRPGDNFVSLEFNLVLFAAFTLMLLRNSVVGYLVDIVAGGLLIYGTLVRKNILYESSGASNVCTTSEETVYNFFVYSLLSWVASAIIEFKSCRFLMCKIRLGGYNVQTLNKRQFCALALSLFASANGCWVMLQYSSAVHKSFEGLTNDPWLLLYYLVAAAAKNIRVFLQGIVYTSWVPEHPFGFIPDKYGKQRMAMGRMGVANSIMLLQAICLSTFPSDASMGTVNTISLYVDIIYRIIVCAWFLQNGCRHVEPTLLTVLTRITSITYRIITVCVWLLQNGCHHAKTTPLTVLTRITSSYNNIVNGTPEDPNRAATEADPNITNGICEDPRHAAAEADPNIANGIPGDLNNAAAEAAHNLILEDLKHEEAPEDPNTAQSSELMLNLGLQATTSACTDNHTTATTECHFLHDSESQAPRLVRTSATETTGQRHSRAEVESPMSSVIHSVEEESSSLNILAGNVLSSNSLFVLFPSHCNDNSHPECQKLIESHIRHNHNHLEFIQSFPNSSDLCTQSNLFHDMDNRQNLEVFQPPQLESSTSFAPSLESIVTGVNVLDVASLSTGKTQLVTGKLKNS